MCSLRSSVALIVIGIAFLGYKHTVLNSSLNKLEESALYSTI